ncbi:hypothetical protein AAEX28_02730 [Lentisphaerota bacterium WC36G]|nr:hypothetical protein LJT99_05610 [Lentisphaerae bacterium WC36]
MKKLIFSLIIGASLVLIATGCGEPSKPKVSANEKLTSSSSKITKTRLEEFLGTYVNNAGIMLDIKKNGKSIYPPTGPMDADLVKLLEKQASFTLPAGITASELAALIAEKYEVNASFNNGSIVINL